MSSWPGSSVSCQLRSSPRDTWVGATPGVCLVARRPTAGRLHRAIALMAAALLGLIPIGCSGTTESKIVGKWSRLDETWAAQRTPRGLASIYTVAIEFRGDGTYTLFNEMGEYTGQLSGKYVIEKSGSTPRLTLDTNGIDLHNLQVTGDSGGGVFAVPRLEWSEARYALRIAGDKLTLAGDAGEAAFLKVMR
jgi:hypothetical protein